MPQDKTVKAAMLLGVGLGFFQQASGSEVRFFFPATVFMRHHVVHTYEETSQDRLRFEIRGRW